MFAYCLYLSESTKHINRFSPATSVKLFYNGDMIGTGITVEGEMIHGKELPPSYQKVAVTSTSNKKIKSMLKTSFDSKYIDVGEIIAWPLSLIEL